MKNQKDDWQADLKAFGVSDDNIKKARAVLEATSQSSSPDASSFLLWPEHVAPLQAFNGAQTQWRVKSNGLSPSSYIGLDYAAVKIVIEAEGLDLGKQGWRDLRVLEDEALLQFDREAKTP